MSEEADFRWASQYYRKHETKWVAGDALNNTADEIPNLFSNKNRKKIK